MADTINQDYVGRIREGTGEFAGEWFVSFGDNDNSWSFGSREEAIHFAAVLKGVTTKHVARARREGAEAMQEAAVLTCRNELAMHSNAMGAATRAKRTKEADLAAFAVSVCADCERAIRALPLPTTEETDR